MILSVQGYRIGTSVRLTRIFARNFFRVYKIWFLSCLFDVYSFATICLTLKAPITNAVDNKKTFALSFLI